MTDFYTAPTPNGYTVAIALEEMSLPYELHALELSRNEQMSSNFLKINPNGRIPVIFDAKADNFVVFEFGAILIYLADKTGQFLSRDFHKRSLVHLADPEYLAIDYSIADLATWTWARIHQFLELESSLKHLQHWIDAIATRLAVEKGIQIPPSYSDEECI